MKIHPYLEKCLTTEGIGPQWWKVGNNGDSTVCVALDFSIQRGIQLAERFLDHPDVQVEILTLITKDDYIEIGLTLSKHFNEK